MTGGAIGSATQRQKLLDYMRDDCDLAADDLTKSTVGNLLRGDLDERARELLNIRQQAAATSPAKYKVLLQSTSADGRLRGTIQFCGASRTGRDAGRIFQPQNLPRPSLDASTIDMGIEAMKLDCEDLLFDNVSDLCTSAIRGALVAEPKHKLVVADLSNIEGRVLAWLAGEEWKLKAFRDFDAGTGHDLYVMAYAQSFQISPEEVVRNKKYGDGSMRQIGKVQELACFGPDTQVLTSNGIKPIIKVDEDDLLWDGVEWVTHQGLVNKGIRPVMELDGVLVTPDHQVLARGTWLSAQTVASSPNCLVQALATGKASLWWLALTSGQQGDLEPSVSNALAERLRMKSRSATGVKEQAPAVIGAQRKPAPAGVKSGMATLTSAQTPRIAGDCATAYPPASTGATTHAIAPTTTTAAGASTFTNLGERIDALFSGISSRLMAGINLNSSLTELMSTGVTSLTISASSVGALTVTTCDVFQTSNDASTNSSVVYDIAHAGPRNRFTILTDSGALVVHNCGYQGGAGAFIKMGGTIAEHLGEDRIQEIVQAWRRAHPATKSFWYDMEGAAKMAIRDPGASYSARLITFVAKTDQMGTDWLLMRLPSGRSLCYRNASVDRESGQILYEGVNQYTRKWSILETYGGKLVENCVQAVARDVFMSGLKRAEAAGYAVCLRVHDELICETPDEPRFSHEELASLMATNPHWAPMLPLAAAGFETRRYRKD